MTDDELVDFAMAFRDGILDGGSSAEMCYVVSCPLAGFLNFHGIKNEIVESIVDDVTHCWLRLDDGRVLDPTADQFNATMPPVYLGPPTTLHDRLA